MKKIFLAKMILLGILSFNTASAFQLFCNEPQVLKELKKEFNSQLMEEAIKIIYQTESQSNPNMNFETFKEFMLDIFNSPEKRRMFGMSDEDYKESFGMFEGIQFVNINKIGNDCSAEAIHPEDETEESMTVKYSLNPVKITNLQEIVNQLEQESNQGYGQEYEPEEEY